MKYYTSNIRHQFLSGRLKMSDRKNSEMEQIKLYPDVTYQTVLGMGGAFTEAAAHTFAQMGAKEKDALLELYFGESGNRYNFCRTHIQSCDFSLGNYAYVEDDKDGELVTFQIERDRQYLIPLIKAAQKKNPRIALLASPWSPPAFMKTNKEMNHGGQLKREFYGMWAKMLAKYVTSYREEGIEISRMTVQNEPEAVQTWESCLFDGRQEQEFACKYLRKALEESGNGTVKLNIWDHNKERMLERARECLNTQEAREKISGIGFHWYTGDHFEALQQVRQEFPEKELIFTEGCVEFSRFDQESQVSHAEMYAHDIIGNFNGGMQAFIDWNLYLDDKGGPNHVGNYCGAPIMCDTRKNRIEVRLPYYYIGHFSRFIRPGAKRFLVSRYTDALEGAGFVNPDGSRVLVLLNRTEALKRFTLCQEEKICDMQLEAHSILTILWDRDEDPACRS